MNNCTSPNKKSALRIALSVIIAMCVFLLITPSRTVLAETQPKATKVLFIVLDEAPLFPLLKTDGTINRDRYPGFASLADNSTWYRNMVTTAQRTTEAVPAILDGKWPTFKNYPYLKDHPNNLFTLLRPQMQLDVYQAVTHLCPKGVCNNAPPRDDKKLLLQVKQLQDVVTRASASTNPTLHFAHVLLPHRPWGLVPDLRYMSDVLEYPDPRSEFLVDRRRDNYQSMLRQYVATDALIGDLVTKMKASNNWDNTMIVVTADHGITFEPGKSYRDTIDIKSPGTLEDIFRVPLFIKYPGQSAPIVSNCPASSIDLLPTVLSANGTDIPRSVHGANLATSCPKRTSRVIRWPDGSFSLKTSFASLVKRVKYYDNWIDADSDVDGIYRSGRSGSLVGTSTPEKAGTNPSLAWRLNLARNYQTIAAGRLAPVPARASGLLYVKKQMCSKCEALIAINGKFVGVVPELAGMKPSSEGQYYSSSLMTRLMQPGQAQVELWIANWTKQTPVLTRVGLPRNTVSTAGK